MRRTWTSFASLCSAVSLLLCAMFVIAWLLSYVRYSISSSTGQLRVAVVRGGHEEDLAGESPEEQWKSRRAAATWSWHFGGIGIYSGEETKWLYEGGYSFNYTLVELPYRVLVFITALLPAFMIARSARARHRTNQPRCAHCGYDLRASPERCPECGAAPT